MMISGLLRHADSLFDKLKQKRIVILANLQSKVSQKYNVVSANYIEKFTDKEFEEILDAIDDLHLEYSVYSCELDFISDILNSKLDKRNIIVLNFARDGLKEGKKSLVPSFCDLLGIKYTSSNAFVQSLCRNKFVYNKYLKQLGLPVPRTYAYFPTKEWYNNCAPTWTTEKVIIKPLAESGSIGVSTEIKSFKDIDVSKVNFINNQTMLFQEYIEGVEVECAFFLHKNKLYILPPIQLVTQNLILDEKSSMSNAYSFKLYEGVAVKKIYSLVKRAVPALGMTNYGRIDFRVMPNGKVFLFDVATMPYICNHSSVVFAMEQQGYSKSDIYKIILTEHLS